MPEQKEIVQDELDKAEQRSEQAWDDAERAVDAAEKLGHEKEDKKENEK